MRYSAAVMAVAILGSALLPLSALAAGESTNITTSPIAVDISVKPGQSKTTTLQVQNNGSKTVILNVEATTFTAKGSNGEAAINPKQDDPSLKYVSFSPSTVTAEPGVWKQVQMTISLPLTASLGYYYAVLFKPDLPKGTTQNTSTFNPSNAVLVLVDSNTGNEHRSLHIDSFTATKKLYEYLPVQFMISIRNDGNIFIPPQGVVYISKDASFKSSIATIPFNKADGRVLPGTNREFTVFWRDGFPVFQDKTSLGRPVTDKKGTAIQQLEWDFTNTNKLRFGKYYARLTVVYNNGVRDVPEYAVVSFWVIPWKMILVLLAIIAVQIYIVVTLVRYRKAFKAVKKSNKQDNSRT
jgi:hypothetical protein